MTKGRDNQMIRFAKHMSKRLILIAIALCFMLGAAADSIPRRVISVIPATTEMIFAMGAGSRVVAVA